jgi:hypothetical protein
MRGLIAKHRPDFFDGSTAAAGSPGCTKLSLSQDGDNFHKN